MEKMPFCSNFALGKPLKPFYSGRKSLKVAETHNDN